MGRTETAYLSILSQLQAIEKALVAIDDDLDRIGNLMERYLEAER